MYEHIYKELTNIVDIITKGHNDKDDFKQEVVLYLLCSDKVKKLYKEDVNQCMLYTYGVAYRMWHFKDSKFHRRYKINYLLNEDKESYINEAIEFDNCKDNNTFEAKDYMDNLSNIDKVWLSELQERNFNKSWLSKDTGISQRRVNNKVKELKDKILKEWIY